MKEKRFLVIDSEQMNESNFDEIKSFNADFASCEAKNDASRIISLHEILLNESVLGAQRQRLVKMVDTKKDDPERKHASSANEGNADRYFVIRH